MDTNAFMEQFEIVKDELKNLLNDKDEKELKKAFKKVVANHNGNEEEALDETAVLFIYYATRNQLEPDSCEFDDFPKHLGKFADEKVKPNEYVKKHLEQVTHIATSLRNFKKDDLYDLAKAMELKGISSMRKDELTEEIVKTMQDEDYIREMLMGMTDEKLNLLNKIVSHGVYTANDEELAILSTFPPVLICYSNEKDVFIAKEVEAVYKKVYTEKFRQERSLHALLNGLARMIQFSYGFLHKEEIIELIEMVRYEKVTPKKAKEYLSKLVELSNGALVEKDDFIGVEGVLNDPDFAKIEEQLKDLPAGTPSLKEIEDLGQVGFPQSLKEYARYEKALLKTGLPAEMIALLLVHTYQSLALTNDDSFIKEQLEKVGLNPTERPFRSYIYDIKRVTRCRLYHGMSLNEYEKWLKLEAKEGRNHNSDVRFS